MKIGIVGGTGAAGSALAARLAAGGAEVVIGSRSTDRAVEAATAIVAKWPDRTLAVSGGSNEDAARCEIVVLATPWEGAVATSIELAGVLEGRTLVSMVNALSRMGREFQALVPVRGSVAATIQAAIPTVNVAAAFQHLPAHELGELGSELAADVLVCADDPSAAQDALTVIGFMPGLRGVLCGSLASANAVEAMTAVLLNVNVKYKSHVAIRLEGLNLPSTSSSS
jgi:NADPH-dependent F420 reductase